MKNYCFDANFVMELLQKREHHHACRKFLLAAANEGSGLYISVLTLDIVYNLVEKYKLPIAAAKNVTNPYQLLDVLAVDAAWALAEFKDKDLEDALQIAVAIRSNCDTFVTLDKPLSKKYSSKTPIKLITVTN